MATELEGSNDQLDLTIEQRLQLSLNAARLRGVSRVDLENNVLNLLANNLAQSNVISDLQEALVHHHQFTIALDEWLKMMAARSGAMTDCLIEAADALGKAGLDASGFKVLAHESRQTTEAIATLVNNLNQPSGG